MHTPTDADIVYLGRVELRLRERSLWTVSSDEIECNEGTTLKRACSISSTGVSFSWPFFARPTAVRFAKVMTTSSGCFSRIAAKPRGRVAELAARESEGEKVRLRAREESIGGWEKEGCGMPPRL